MKKKTMKKAMPSMKMDDMSMKKDTDMGACQTCKCGSCGCMHGSSGLTVLRVVVGALFLLHGIQKFTGLDGVQSFFGQIGIWPWLAFVIALAETLGGIALILGIFSRWAGYGLATIMIGAFAFAAFGWGGWGWLLVIAGAVGFCAMDCSSSRNWGCWLTSIVLVIVVALALWKQIAGGINPMANLERDLAFLAALVVIAWNGPGMMSMHSKCGCCDH